MVAIVIAVLTFDSASVALLDALVESGRLPNVAALAERGRRVELETPARDFAAGAFYTLYSGVEIGDHGIFYPFQWDARRQSVRQAGELEAPPAVWERLARAGKRTLAIDPYECRPPERIEGTIVSGWGFEERTVLPGWSRPQVARRALARELGRPPRATEVFGRPRSSQLISLRRRLLDAPSRVADAAVHMLDQEQYDLAWLTFSAAHLAGHQFWDLSQLRRALDQRRAPHRCSSARSPRSTGASTRRSAGSCARCRATPTWSSARRWGWTSTRAAPTCCRGCSPPCSRAAPSRSRAGSGGSARRSRPASAAPSPTRSRAGSRSS